MTEGSAASSTADFIRDARELAAAARPGSLGGDVIMLRPVPRRHHPERGGSSRITRDEQFPSAAQGLVSFPPDSNSGSPVSPTDRYTPLVTPLEREHDQTRGRGRADSADSQFTLVSTTAKSPPRLSPRVQNATKKNSAPGVEQEDLGGGSSGSSEEYLFAPSPDDHASPRPAFAGAPAHDMSAATRDDKERPPPRRRKERLGELQATAICGNDITASCFYIVGQLCRDSGIYAPLCTLFASLVLFCFRKIYTEVVCALPLNGGVYNLLLNSSTKRVASVAACLTILSYVATGVVSAVSAMQYLAGLLEGWGPAGVQQEMLHGPPADAENDRTIFVGALSILFFFAALMLVGIRESGNVAALLFIFHLGVLSVLLVCCFYTTYLQLEMFLEVDIFHLIAKNARRTNRDTTFPWWSPPPSDGSESSLVLPEEPLNMSSHSSTSAAQRFLAGASPQPSEGPRSHRIFRHNLSWQHQNPTFESIFFGFSTAMLGVSGFETSANFVENQKAGIFPKTLRNMWIAVTAMLKVKLLPCSPAP